MIPGLLVDALLGSLLGGAYGLGGRTSSPTRRRGGLFSTEEERFTDFMGSRGVATPATGATDADGGNLMNVPYGEAPATLDFPEKGARQTPPPVPPPLPDQATDDWFVEVPEREVAKTFAGKALFAMIAAAHADGDFSGPERTLIEGRLASLPPAEKEFIERELDAPRPLDAFADPADPLEERRTIFALAVAVLKADGKVGPTENRFAGRLAAALGLTKNEAEAIVRRIAHQDNKGA